MSSCLPYNHGRPRDTGVKSDRCPTATPSPWLRPKPKAPSSPARPILDELTAQLTTLAITASNEHLLLLGERGMGKTTMLLMLRPAVS